MRTQVDVYWLIDMRKEWILTYDKDNNVILKTSNQKPFTGQVDFANGGIVWILNGKIHHPIKPAYNVDERIEYWLDGIELTFEQFWEKQKDTIYANKIMANLLGSKLE